MKRITPEEVVEAYKVTGLKPMQGDYFPQEGCACGLGVMSYLNGITDNATANTFTGEEYGRAYRCAFAEGFDGLNERHHVDTTRVGYIDGRAAWSACAAAGLVDGESA